MFSLMHIFVVLKTCNTKVKIHRSIRWQVELSLL